MASESSDSLLVSILGKVNALAGPNDAVQVLLNKLTFALTTERDAATAHVTQLAAALTTERDAAATNVTQLTAALTTERDAATANATQLNARVDQLNAEVDQLRTLNGNLHNQLAVSNTVHPAASFFDPRNHGDSSSTAPPNFFSQVTRHGRNANGDRRPGTTTDPNEPPFDPRLVHSTPAKIEQPDSSDASAIRVLRCSQCTKDGRPCNGEAPCSNCFGHQPCLYPLCPRPYCNDSGCEYRHKGELNPFTARGAHGHGTHKFLQHL